MLVPDLAVTLSQRRRRCVIDPALTLSRFGVPLARQVSSTLELWMVRELWHILDNSRYYLESDQALDLCEASAGMRDSAIAELRDSIRDWERIRLEKDMAGLRLYWVGDGLSESLLPENADADLLWRCETMACALDRRVEGSGAIASATRDAAALAASLGSAIVLTLQTHCDREQNRGPLFCQRLSAWDVQCKAIAPDDPVAAIERDQLRQALVSAGVASLLWSGMRLAVVHVNAPAAMMLRRQAEPPEIPAIEDMNSESIGLDTAPDPWRGAQAFWYPV